MFLMVPPKPVDSWPLEMGQADKDIGVHDGAADLGGLAVFAVGTGTSDLIGAAQTVAR